MKQFVPVRVDVGVTYQRCVRELHFLGIDIALLTAAIINNLFKDRCLVFNHLELIAGQRFIENRILAEQLVHEISEEAFFRMTGLFPSFSPGLAEMIPVADGQLDCIVYVELNEHTKPLIPPIYHSRSVDEVALSYLSRQYRY